MASAHSFASFPASLVPSPANQSEDTARPRRRSKDKDEDDDKQHRKHSHSKKHKHDRDKARRSPSRSSSRHQDNHPQFVPRPRDDEAEHARQFIAAIPNSSANPFYYDSNGDPDNITYGGLNQRQVPRHTLVAGGKKVLGLGDAFSIIYRSSKGVEIGLHGRRRRPATLTDSKSRALLHAPPTRRWMHSDSSRTRHEENDDGFLRLPSRKGKSVEDERESYRTIELSKINENSDSQQSSDEAADDLDSSDDEDVTHLTSHQERSKALEQRLTDKPSDISTWLEFLAHTISAVPPGAKNAAQMRSDMTLSVLSRALSASASNRASKILRLKQLRAGAEIWHESKLRAEWEDALKLDDADVWLEWLDWRIRHAAQGIDSIVQDAQRVLLALKGDNDSIELGQTRVLWRVGVAFCSAGYFERATALFQAQAELAFSIPRSLQNAPLEQLLDTLEEFWESEVPRCGELGSKGWASWTSDVLGPSSIIDDTILPLSLPSAQTNTNDPFKRWAEEEQLADRAGFLPLRSTEESDDPYATVLFSDIRPLLSSSPLLHSRRAKHAFRLTWLALLGLHVPGFVFSLSPTPGGDGECIDDRWCYTHLTSAQYLDMLLPSTKNTAKAGSQSFMADSYAGVLLGKEREYTSSFGPVKHWTCGVHDPLEAVGGKALWSKEDVDAVDQDFVRRIFERLRMSETEDVEWDVLTLAFEAAVNIKGALKRSRAFLSAAPASMPHWQAHARLERLRGRPEDARKVYQNVLTPQRASAWPQLWWDWAQTEWLASSGNKNSNSDATLSVIMRSVGIQGQPGSGIALLRTIRALDDLVEAQSSSSTSPNHRSVLWWKDREAWMLLRILVDLIANGYSSAMNVANTFLRAIQCEPAHGSTTAVTAPTTTAEAVVTAAHESLSVGVANLLYNYGTVLRNSMSPTVLRECVDAALKLYPSNSTLLALFLEGEKGQGVWGRVRALLGEAGAVDGNNGRGSRKEKDVARRVAEVWIGSSWEKGGRYTELERVRSGLANAVEGERTRASHVLWRIYVEFEIRTGNLRQAKKILYRAIGECPLCKDLYMLAFGPLRSVFDTKELASFADAMAERSVRMRKGLDEVLEGWRSGLEDKMHDEDGNFDPELDDNIEENARELRRLRPY